VDSQQIGTCPKCSRSSPPENNTPTSDSLSQQQQQPWTSVFANTQQPCFHNKQISNTTRKLHNRRNLFLIKILKIRNPKQNPPSTTTKEKEKNKSPKTLI
jgi:hypothetical protein